MYHTMKEVLLAVREKYSSAKSLSKGQGIDAPGCFYKHDFNGIGCAIGCLYPKDVAEEMDGMGGIDDWGESTWELYGREMFGHRIHRDSLRILQNKHDTSNSVEQFLHILDHRIETGRWMSVDKAKEQLNEET